MKKDSLNISVGKRIRSTRENMGYTRESFSELCDISDSFLSDVERGNKSLTTKTLYKICSASRVSADYILFGTTSTNFDTGEELTDIVALLTQLDKSQCFHAYNILKKYYLALNKL